MTRTDGKDGLNTASGPPAGKPGCSTRFFGKSYKLDCCFSGFIDKTEGHVWKIQYL